MIKSSPVIAFCKEVKDCVSKKGNPFITYEFVIPENFETFSVCSFDEPLNFDSGNYYQISLGFLMRGFDWRVSVEEYKLVRPGK